MKASCLAIAFFIFVMVIGTVDAQTDYDYFDSFLAEAREHFEKGELSQASDALFRADQIALMDKGNFQKQIAMLQAYLYYGSRTNDPTYNEYWGTAASQIFNALEQNAEAKLKDPNTREAGLSELDRLANIGIPEGIRYRDSMEGIRQAAEDAAENARRSPTPTPTASTVCSWDGTWSTEWGEMKLRQSSSGNTVSGGYPYNSGTIFGTVLGNTLSGKWVEKPPAGSAIPDHYSGNFVFFMNDDCSSFKGQYNHKDSQTWKYDWNGKRK